MLFIYKWELWNPPQSGNLHRWIPLLARRLRIVWNNDLMIAKMKLHVGAFHYWYLHCIPVMIMYCRAPCERCEPLTSLFPLCWRCTVEKIVYIFLQDFSKKKTLSMSVSCRFFVRKTDDILRTLLLMHDGVSFGKNKCVILGHETLENKEFGLTARSATSRF
jgi:hypothetical protein